MHTDKGTMSKPGMQGGEQSGRGKSLQPLFTTFRVPGFLASLFAFLFFDRFASQCIGGLFPLPEQVVHCLRNTATTFSTGTTNRRLSPSKSTGIASLGWNSTRSYCSMG